MSQDGSEKESPIGLLNQIIAALVPILFVSLVPDRYWRDLLVAIALSYVALSISAVLQLWAARDQRPFRWTRRRLVLLAVLPAVLGGFLWLLHGGAAR